MPKLLSRSVLVPAGAAGGAYFLAASTTILLTRFDGGVASMWIATAVLVAALAPAGRTQRLAMMAGSAVASMLATSLFGLGIAAAVPMAVGNIGEAALTIWCLSLLDRRTDYLDSFEGVGAFALAAAASAAVVAIPAGATAAMLVHMSFVTEWRNWFAGHALGTLAFAPIFTLILNGEIPRWARTASTAARIEALVILSAMATICVGVFAQSMLPLLFLPILPLMVATFRMDRVGTTIAIVILAAIGGTLTSHGAGPVSLINGSEAVHAHFFQFYLAVTVLTVLPVAAELRQHKTIFRRLVDSETRFKLITESATDIVMTLDADGVISYVSPSVLEITGFDPHDLVDRKPHALLSGPDARTVIAAYREAREHPDRTSVSEYRAETVHGKLKWFEARTRGLLDGAGNPAGFVSTIRDITERKTLEFKLARAATTDPLTGLSNRRAFDALLDRCIADRRRGDVGCIAIFDIDVFKAVNDRFGHAAGDIVLERFAAAAQRSLRVGDHLARLGGEEFGIILGGADIEQALGICDRLRLSVAHEIMLTPDGQPLSITVSAGIAAIAGAESRAQLMRAADDALYRAKAEGRDRLAIAA